jgi:hypothetical protein
LKQTQTIKLFFPEVGLEEARFSRTRRGNALLFDAQGVQLQIQQTFVNALLLNFQI